MSKHIHIFKTELLQLVNLGLLLPAGVGAANPQRASPQGVEIRSANRFARELSAPRALVLCLFAWSCPTLCDAMDYIAQQFPLSTGILQARILEWVAMPPPGHEPLEPCKILLMMAMKNLKNPPELGYILHLFHPSEDQGFSASGLLTSGLISLCCGSCPVLCIMLKSLASTHQMPIAPHSSCDPKGL